MDTGKELTVTKDMTQLARDQVDLIRHTVAVGATDLELKLFLYQADKRGLDPLLRQIHFIKRKRYNADTEKYEEVGTIQTGIDGFRVVAGRTGQLSGIKRGVIKDADGKLLGAWAEIYRKDWTEPAREEVSFGEYCQKRKDGEPMGLWKTMPETMIKKVAEAAALRMAFPEDLSGIYTHDEMQQADVEVVAIETPKRIEGKTKEKLEPAVKAKMEEYLAEPEPEPPLEAPQDDLSPIEEETGSLPLIDGCLNWDWFKKQVAFIQKMKVPGWDSASVLMWLNEITIGDATKPSEAVKLLDEGMSARVVAMVEAAKEKAK